MIRLAIIGSSGKNPLDLEKYSIDHFTFMTETINSYIKNTIQTELSNIILVSNGSAWADHVAVQLYLTRQYGGLELYLASKFDLKHSRYVNTHEGRSLNKLHQQCQEKTQINVLGELAKVQYRPNVKITVKRGFVARNTLVAHNCDHIITFTFSETVLDNIIVHTLNKVKHNNKYHAFLNA